MPAAAGVPGFNYGGGSGDDLMKYDQGTWNKYSQSGVQPTGIDPSLAKAQWASQGDIDASRKNEADAMGLMQAYATGAKQTPAELQAQRALAYNRSGQAAAMANAGGPQALAAARATNTQSNITSDSMSANANRALAAQEQQSYAKQYQDMANQVRGNEQSLYGINNNAAYADAQTQMQLNQANDSLMLGYSGLASGATNAQHQLQIGQGQFVMGQSQQGWNSGMQLAGGMMGASGGLASGAQGIYNSGQGGGGSGGGGNSDPWQGNYSNNPDVVNSDERLKEDVHHGLMSPFLDALEQGRATYRYKDPSNEPKSVPTGGRYAGVMAQDLEMVPELGGGLVHDTPHGKLVDTHSFLSALGAGVGELHARIKQLEGFRNHDE